MLAYATNAQLTVPDVTNRLARDAAESLKSAASRFDGLSGESIDSSPAS